jgi:RimJ/RimL family protein N-acetyltransferase
VTGPWEGVSPPYRIETERLVLRCWEPSDAEALDEAVAESIDELRPWMQWAAEPMVEPTVEVLRRFRGAFDLGHEFILGLFSHDGAVLGGSGLHPRFDGGVLEIGYWVRTSRTREGLATAAAAALTRVGVERCEVGRMDIQVEPGNEPSLGVARKLGYAELGVMQRQLPPLRRGNARRDAVLFSLLADDLGASPCASVEYEAFDAAGRRLP